MNEQETILFLNRELLDEMPALRAEAARFSVSRDDQRALLRALMNVREPHALSERFLCREGEKGRRLRRGAGDRAGRGSPRAVAGRHHAP